MIRKFLIFNFKFLISKDKWLILGSIIFIAIFFRFFLLGGVPPSASLDEASIGYNAYSILKTGGDEYGNKFPIILRAYDDWRPALYVYTVIPFVWISDLNVEAVRLPSVLLSVLTVAAVYFLVKELFEKLISKESHIHKYIEVSALISTFLFAVSPWHIYISRLGHEANLGFSFFVFGLLFFLKNKIPLLFLFFAVSFASYQAEKIFLPIFLIGLFFVFRKELFAARKKVLVSAVLATILLIPFLYQTFQPNALIRFNATSIFDNNSQIYQEEAIMLKNAVDNNDVIGVVLHNRRMVTARLFIEGYFSHFSPQWLFGNSGSDAHKVPNSGLLYLFELPFIIAGIIYLFSKTFSNKIRMILLFWLLSSPVPGALTTDAPHAMRIYTVLPLPQILAGLGLVFVLRAIEVFDLLKNKLLAKGILLVSFMLVAVSVLYMSFMYFFVFPKEQSDSFQYALHSATRYVIENEDRYEKIVFSNQKNLYQSYMFFLFNSKYDPVQYQREGGTGSGGFAKTHQFGKYEFRPIKWDREEKESGTLYVGNVDDFPEEYSGIRVFRYLNGKEAVKIVEN